MISRFLRVGIACLISAIFLATYTQPAHALVKISGTFTASQSCPALSSTRRLSNPGNVRIAPEVAYPLVGKNQPDPDYYQIRVDGARPPVRWVEVGCGTINETIATRPPVTQSYVLAASWQPSFCETQPDRSECQSLTGDRFDATSFSIHGLWPDTQYCNVSREIELTDREGNWAGLPEIELSAELRDELAIKMPGYQSNLHRHEWYKHGTCYSETPEEYFQETIHLLDQLNASAVRTLFVENLEQDLTKRQLKVANNEAFKAGRKFSTSCVRAGGERLIDGLHFNLRGDIDLTSDMSDLIAAAPTLSSAGCTLGQVDSATESSEYIEAAEEVDAADESSGASSDDAS